MSRIKTIAVAKKKSTVGCGECRSTCQSACKTSCTVAPTDKYEKRYFKNTNDLLNTSTGQSKLNKAFQSALR